MADFNFLQQGLDPHARTALYTFREIPWDPPVVFTVRYAGPDNAEYWNMGMEHMIANAQPLDGAQMPKFNTHQERMRWTNEQNERAERKQHAADLYAFPRCIITGWTGVVDGAGAMVLYSLEDCERFLRALPKLSRDRLFAFCKNPDNFRGKLDRPALVVDVAAASGNS